MSSARVSARVPCFGISDGSSILPRPRTRGLHPQRAPLGSSGPPTTAHVRGAARARGRRARHARAAARSRPLRRRRVTRRPPAAGRCRRGCAPSIPPAGTASRGEAGGLALALERLERVVPRGRSRRAGSPSGIARAERSPRTRLRSARRSPASAARARTGKEPRGRGAQQRLLPKGGHLGLLRDREAPPASTGSSRGTRPSTEWRMPILSRRARKSSTRLVFEGRVRTSTRGSRALRTARRTGDGARGSPTRMGRRGGGEPAGPRQARSASSWNGRLGT